MSESVRLENVIICYPHLFEKHAPPGTDPSAARYGAEFLLDPQSNVDDCQRVEAAFEQVARAAGKGDQMQFLKSPLQSGDELNRNALAKGRQARPELEGMRVVRANDRNYAPAVVNARLQPISEANKDQLFGGCIVNAFIDLFWSSNPTNPGVYAGLRGVQLVDNVNVQPLGGGKSDPASMFEVVKGAPEPLQEAREAGPKPAGPEESWM